MNKNITLLLIGLLFLLVLLAIIVYTSTTGNKKVVPTPTPSASPTSILEEALQKQTEADINVAQMQEEVLRKYPWYLKLPLQEKNYFVYFDASKNIFQASVYPQKSSSISTETQVKSYQDEILERLKRLGVDTVIYHIEWEIKPE